MAHLKQSGAVLLALASLCGSGQAWGRQNIVIGEISVGYDFQERSYDDNDVDTVRGRAVTTDGTTEAVVLTPASALNAADEGDTRSLFVTPRVRFSSRDVADLFEFTYAPTFTYDEIDSSSDVGHDFRLLGERHITKDWLVRATDSYFYGDDSQADYQRQGEGIVPTTEAQPETQPVGAGPEEAAGRQLTDQYGRSKYWRNDFGLSTDYTYAQDSVVGLGYNYGVLRNVDDGGGDDYDDYDRHEATGRLSYRINTQWSAETELAYVKGLYDETEITEVRVTQPEPVEPANNDRDDSDEGSEREPEPAEPPEPIITSTTEGLNDDLVEYHGRLRVNYNWGVHEIFFGQYSYQETDYESPLEEDSVIHEGTLGWEHDFSNRLRMTLSGGPTLVTYDESPDETGYNAYAGLTYAFPQSLLSAHTSYNYEFDNFDGRRSGLSKVWRSEIGFTHQFSQAWQAAFIAGYEQSDHDEPYEDEIVVVLDGDSDATAIDLAAREGDHFSYREETWDAGLTVRYSFLRWYTASLSYRYADYQSEVDQDYDEHRVMLTLTAAKEIFRW